MERDSEKTRQTILKAVGDLLAEDGFQRIGVNAVARRAGVDKVLIYRYFGNLPKLLGEFGRSNEFWPDNDTMMSGWSNSEHPDPAGLGREILTRHLDHLVRNPLTREILRWELSQKNELTQILAEIREEQGMELISHLGLDEEHDGGIDYEAVGAIIHAGLSYLALRSDSADVYMGVSLASDAGWDRIRSAIGTLIGAVFQRESQQTKGGIDERQ